MGHSRCLVIVTKLIKSNYKTKFSGTKIRFADSFTLSLKPAISIF